MDVFEIWCMHMMSTRHIYEIVDLFEILLIEILLKKYGIGGIKKGF